MHGGSQNYCQTNDAEVADVLDECMLVHALMTSLRYSPGSLGPVHHLRNPSGRCRNAFAFQDASQDTTDSSKLNVQ